MRTEIITGLQALTLGTFRVATELPFESQGQPLYEKNFKTFYADRAQTATETLVNSLNGPQVREKETTVVVYVVTDAKNQPGRPAISIVKAKISQRFLIRVVGRNGFSHDIRPSVNW